MGTFMKLVPKLNKYLSTLGYKSFWLVKIRFTTYCRNDLVLSPIVDVILGFSGAPPY